MSTMAESAEVTLPAGLQDDTNRDQLTTTLLTLAESHASSATATITLYSTLSQLVSPLLLTPDSAIPLAHYLTTQLFPQLAQATPPDHQQPTLPQQLADIILDVVWQLDQQLDAGWLRQQPTAAPPQPVEDSMQVDEATAAKSDRTEEQQATAEAADKLKAEAAHFAQLEKEGRERLVVLVNLLMNANILLKSDILTRLDASFLAAAPLSLLPHLPTFHRMEARARTALYYKQQKFNLLREESEGFSKLVVELLSNMGPAHSAVDGRSVESEAERMRRAKSVGDKVKNLIGNFDLDPDRTLDLILDTFSDQLVQHHQFFLDFLAVSPWAPKRKSSASAEMDVDVEAEGKGKAREVPVAVGLEEDEGSNVIGQILGFKFGYYQSEGAPETPEKLYLLAGLLIYNGFVKLAHLWPHLSPDDAELGKVEETYRQSQEQLARSVGGANALAMAGALVDDEAPKSTSAGAGTSSSKGAASGTASAPPPPRPLPNQKLGLLRALLSLGDVAHSLFILAQWPYLAAAHLDLVDLLHRLMSVAIAPAYEGISLARSKEQWQDEFGATRLKFVSVDKGSVKVEARGKVLTGRAVGGRGAEGQETFFWAQWRSRVPKCGDWDEVLDVLETMFLPFAGGFLSRDSTLFSKICRIVVKDLSLSPGAPESHPRYTRWINILRQYLLPSLSLLEHHAPAAMELWSILRLLPAERRYQLYGEWKDALYRRVPALGVRKAEAERDIKSVLRRLSTDNAKVLGKTLAKIAHTNPTIVFAVTLHQVQSYDNLIVPVVDAVRYLTDFGYDVLSYSVLDALSASKSKTKEDGTSVALWLQGLATFAGQLYRRWSSMSSSLWILLQYLVNQLASGNSKDLIVLRELIARMTAIEPFADLSDAQVNSLAGGKVLRSEVFQQTELSQAGRRLQMEQMAAARERLTIELKRSKLAVPLLVNIALQRKACTATEAHLKSLGALFDQNHAVLFQYMELLAAISDADDLALMVPTAAELMDRYGLDAAVAFDIGRPKLRLAIKTAEEKDAIAQDQRRKAMVAAKLAKEKGDASATTTSSSTPGSPAASPLVVKVEGGAEEDVKMEEVAVSEVKVETVAGDLVGGEGESPAPRVTPSPWHRGLLDDIKRFETILPVEVQAQLGTPFFVTFWQLTLHDIFYPKERYDSELSRCGIMQREATASTTLSPEERDRFIKTAIELANKLMKEAVKHQTAIKGVARRLTKESKAWFPNVQTRNDRSLLVDQIYQHCIEPRARLSLPDAVYSYALIKKMHQLNAPGFITVVIFDKILTSAVGPLLFACSENEARNFARFLFDLLTDVHSWHRSEEVYKAEAHGAGLHGFARDLPLAPSGPPAEFIDHDRFKNIVKRWHAKMVKGFVASFESGEYMHIKNSILVLTKLAPVFPVDYENGAQLETSIVALLAVEKREDLTILAQGYKAVISKRRKHWADQPPKVDSPAPTPAPKTASPATAIPARPALQSNASAPAPATTNGGVPTGPKHGLPVRPGQGSAPATPLRSSQIARPAENDVKAKPEVKSNAMDVDKPLPTGPAASRPAAAEPARASEPANGARNGLPSSLPARPGTTNSGSSSSTNGLSATDKLRQDALGSRNKSGAPATSMDPPPAPSSTGGATATGTRRPADLPAVPSAPRGPARDEKRDDSRRERDRDDRRGDDRSTTTGGAGATTSSRPASPRGSDSGRRGRDSDRVDRERARARSRSLESTHSGSRGSRSERPKEPSRSSRDERDRTSSSRGGKDDRHHESRGDRERERERERDRDEGRRRDDRRRGDDDRRDEDRRRAGRDPRDRRGEDDRRRSDDRDRKEPPSGPRGRDERGVSSSTSKAPTGPRSQRDSPRDSPRESRDRDPARPVATTLPTGPAAASASTSAARPAPSTTSLEGRLKPAPAMRKQQEAQHKEGDSPKAKEQEKAAAPNQPPKLAEAPKPPSLPTGPASLPANPNIPARPPPPAFNVRGSALGLGAANKILGAAGLGGDGGAGRRRDSREGSSSGPPRGEEGRGGSRDSRREGGGEDREQGRKRNLADRLDADKSGDSDNPPKRPREDSRSSSRHGSRGPSYGRR